MIQRDEMEVESADKVGRSIAREMSTPSTQHNHWQYLGQWSRTLRRFGGTPLLGSSSCLSLTIVNSELGLPRFSLESLEVFGSSLNSNVESSWVSSVLSRSAKLATSKEFR